jgi:hypothetical protein
MLQALEYVRRMSLLRLLTQMTLRNDRWPAALTTRRLPDSNHH